MTSERGLGSTAEIQQQRPVGIVTGASAVVLLDENNRNLPLSSKYHSLTWYL